MHHACRPARIEVWRTNDAGAIGNDFTEEVGVQLTDLKLVLFDESDNEIELPVRCACILLQVHSCVLHSKSS